MWLLNNEKDAAIKMKKTYSSVTFHFNINLYIIHSFIFQYEIFFLITFFNINILFFGILDSKTTTNNGLFSIFRFYAQIKNGKYG